jgi:hypothetical protein
MSAIHLSGNVWINDLYTLVSESCKSMVGHTADLGKCLCDAELITCFTHVICRNPLYWGFPSCGDNAVNRAMIRVVATVVLVSGNMCEASSLLYCFLAYFYTVRFGLK